VDLSAMFGGSGDGAAAALPQRRFGLTFVDILPSVRR
jgi:hypothetical protein